MLSANHLQHVCLLLQLDSKTCRYLVEDDNAVGVYHCCKLNMHDKKTVDDRVKKIIQTHSGRGTDPNASGQALGDNCKGYISGIKHIEQGYDKDKN